MEIIQDNEGRVLIHCKKKGCPYYEARRGRLIVPGKTLEEAIARLKPGTGYVGGVAPCSEGEHEWELVASDPS